MDYTYENALKCLDAAAKQARRAGLNSLTLEEKVRFHRAKDRLLRARRELFELYHIMEDAQAIDPLNK